MPATIGRPPIPPYVDPDKPQPDDSLLHTLLRKAVGVSGVTDPTSAITSMMNPMGMISIYKDAAGIPSEALRQEGTKFFIDQAHKLHPNIGAAAEWLAKKYPRVAAHMNLGSEPLQAEGGGAAVTHMPEGKITEPIMADFTNTGYNMADKPALARDVLAHELTHVAQGLGNSRAIDLYNAAEDAVGYLNNPFEETARRRGAAAAAESYRPLNRIPGPDEDFTPSTIPQSINSMRAMNKLEAPNSNTLPDALKKVLNGVVTTSNNITPVAPYTVNRGLTNLAYQPTIDAAYGLSTTPRFNGRAFAAQQGRDQIKAILKLGGHPQIGVDSLPTSVVGFPLMHKFKA